MIFFYIVRQIKNLKTIFSTTSLASFFHIGFLGHFFICSDFIFVPDGFLSGREKVGVQ